MIQPQNYEVYQWFDLQALLCEQLQISEQDFYNYERKVGGDYKNLWHLALRSVLPDGVANGTIVKLYFGKYKLEPDESKAWENDFIQAWYNLHAELGLDESQNEIWVEFNW